MTITVERGKADEATFKSLMDFALAGLREAALAPINYDKALREGYDALARGMAFIARDEIDEVVGFVSMQEIAWWYSDEAFLLSQIGPYVRRDQRFGTVGVKLLRAVRDLADERDQLAFVLVNDERQGRKSAMRLFSMVAGYVPVGHVIAIRARREALAAKAVAAE